MIELTNDQITFSFPGVHPDARVVVEFQRTIRIPEGGTEIPRLPSLGRYPLYSVEDHAQRVPAHWLENGGAMLPMYQSEAMWLSFQPAYSVAHDVFYPFAVKVGIGGVDAVTGERWSTEFTSGHRTSWSSPTNRGWGDIGLRMATCCSSPPCHWVPVTNRSPPTRRPKWRAISRSSCIR